MVLQNAINRVPLDWFPTDGNVNPVVLGRGYLVTGGHTLTTPPDSGLTGGERFYALPVNGNWATLGGGFETPGAEPDFDTWNGNPLDSTKPITAVYVAGSGWRLYSGLIADATQYAIDFLAALADRVKVSNGDTTAQITAAIADYALIVHNQGASFSRDGIKIKGGNNSGAGTKFLTLESNDGSVTHSIQMDAGGFVLPISGLQASLDNLQAQIDSGGTMLGTPYAAIGGDNFATPSADTPATMTLTAPGVGLAYALLSLDFSYDAEPASPGTITVSEGGTVKWQDSVTNQGPGPLTPNIQFAANQPITITLSAGGSGVVGRISASVATVDV